MLSKNPSKADKLKSLNLEDDTNISKRVLDSIYKNIVYNKNNTSINISRREKLLTLGLSEHTLFTDLNDEVLHKIYVETMTNALSKQTFCADRGQKLLKLGLDQNISVDELSDNVLDKLYNSKVPEKITTFKKAIGPRLTKDHPKYIVTLDFLNVLLKELNKPVITELIEFKNIKKDDLLEDSCTELLYSNFDKIFTVFDKSDLLYSKRDKIKSYIITILKTMVSLCGHDFNSYLRNELVHRKKGPDQVVYWVEYSIC